MNPDVPWCPKLIKLFNIWVVLTIELILNVQPIFDFPSFILESKRKKVSGCSGKNDPIRGGRFHCVVGNFADAP